MGVLVASCRIWSVLLIADIALLWASSLPVRNLFAEEHSLKETSKVSKYWGLF